MILGLDISTSITGFCVLDSSGEVIRSGAWDMRNKNKFKNTFEKAEFIKDSLCDIKVQYPIDKTFIEKPFMFFGSGGSSAKTMSTLQRFNGVASWMLYEIFEMKPQYVGANEARKKVGIKVPRGQKAKKVVMEHLLKNDEDFKIEYTYHGNPKPQYYDMADALIVARAGRIIEKNKDSS